LTLRTSKSVLLGKQLTNNKPIVLSVHLYEYLSLK